MPTFLIESAEAVPSFTAIDLSEHLMVQPRGLLGDEPSSFTFSSTNARKISTQVPTLRAVALQGLRTGGSVFTRGGTKTLLARSGNKVKLSVSMGEVTPIVLYGAIALENGSAVLAQTSQNLVITFYPCDTLYRMDTHTTESGTA